MWGPTKNLGPIGSAVLTFVGYKQTEIQSRDKQSTHIYIDNSMNKLSREAILIDPVIEKSERDAKLVEELDLKLK